MTWRRELSRLDEVEPTPDLLRRARSRPATSVSVSVRERAPARLSIVVLALAIVVFAALSILAPLHAAKARPYRAAGGRSPVVWSAPR
jgi:hypothetical protein